MTETQTAIDQSPPNNGKNIALAADYPDDIQAIGDQLASMNAPQLRELEAYLEMNGVK